MHLFSEEGNDVVLDDLINEMNKFVHCNNLIVIDVQLLEVDIEVFLGRLYSFQIKVALDEGFKLLSVDFPIVFAVGAVEDLF